eukprot:8299526-Pyramimonas_sp.AAC.1
MNGQFVLQSPLTEVVQTSTALASGKRCHRTKRNPLIASEPVPVSCAGGPRATKPVEQELRQSFAPAGRALLLLLRHLARMLENERALLVAGHRTGRCPSAALLDHLQGPSSVRFVVGGP